MLKQSLAFAFILVAVVFFNSCRKEEFEKGSVSLSFSEDTVLFDTVFTTIGSSTQLFIVYNNGGNPVKISSIRIAGGGGSNFRLNVDGVPGKSFTDVEIGANDSMFIFAEVTVDPNNGNTPLIITDSIIFSANEFMSVIKLVAWGQNAIFHRSPPNSQIAPFFLLNCNEVWTDTLPHVIYGYAMVDSGCALTINEGTNVYLHPGSGIIVLSSGTLTVNGTQQKNVTFQGDRLGEYFKDIPGQWDRIWLSNLNLRSNTISPGTRNSSIKYAVIKNGIIGLQVDTSFDNNPNNLTLELQNTVVKNMASNALALRGSKVNAYNCVFSNCGGQTANILYGGIYNFYHCTFANYWVSGQRTSPAVTLNNYFGSNLRSLNAYFGNSIIHGNNDNEIGLDSFSTGNLFGFRFDHNLIKVESTFPMSDTLRYKAIVRATGNTNEPKFADIENNVYELDSASSPAIDVGSINITQVNPLLNFDLKGNPRPANSSNPDLGAYERR